MGQTLVLRPGKAWPEEHRGEHSQVIPSQGGSNVAMRVRADHGRHVYAKMGRSKECTFCMKLVKKKTKESADHHPWLPPRTMQATHRPYRPPCVHNSCWDTKGFRLWHDFGEKRATTYLTDAMMCQHKDDFSDSD
jgi:hypothetical protein